jgi:hypothetical protein
LIRELVKGEISYNEGVVATQGISQDAQELAAEYVEQLRILEQKLHGAARSSTPAAGGDITAAA